ncbi:MAG: hypothetical protein WDN45_09595 [Caulobacteraceae bacterium]
MTAVRPAFSWSAPNAPPLIAALILAFAWTAIPLTSALAQGKDDPDQEAKDKKKKEDEWERQAGAAAAAAHAVPAPT